MKQWLLVFAVMCAALSCVGEDEPDVMNLPDASTSMDASGVDSTPAIDVRVLYGCGDDDTIAPVKLECTGLYSDWKSKTIAPGVREFTPSTPFWSDGAEKHRWVYLPPGTKIDATDRAEWVFPVGTTFWKEFKINGRRIETRIFKKLRSDRWVNAAYAWAKDEMSTTASMGGDQPDVDLGGGVPYHIATDKECSDCHKGRKDRVLGFEEISLGGPNAAGLTLSKLVAEGLISPAPPSTSVSMPDDGTGMSVPAISWIHINCGVTCHNRNSTATGNGTKMFLRLDPKDLDAKTPAQWDVLATTLNTLTNTPAWIGQTRISPGSPERSLVFHLLSSRGEEQMPPIATHLVDVKNAEAVRAWIAKMAVEPPPPDAGPPDADAGPADAGPPDAGPPDVSDDGAPPPPDAGPDVPPDVSEPPDTGAPDATPDASPPPDVMPDVAPPDAGPDVELPDAGAPDTSTPDAGAPDASDDQVDAGAPDSETPDGSTDDGAPPTPDAPDNDASDADDGGSDVGAD